jgi:DNA-directed RNA polymerase omega subunit
MNETKEHISNGHEKPETNGHTFISNYRLIIVASLRSKQLQRGSKPRIEVDPLRRRYTSIAVEEVKRGLVPYTLVSSEQMAKLKKIEKVDKPWGNGHLVVTSTASSI